ncbi:hypothetical protein MICRO80W_80059 [Micrococcus luteus]|nr:hypothetical protein MICRO80W_80059 [Micrococcus luteus]
MIGQFMHFTLLIGSKSCQNNCITWEGRAIAVRHSFHNPRLDGRLVRS